MASSMRYYTIAITNSITNAAPSDGFIDNLLIEVYYATTPYALETGPVGLTLALCAAKRRGNVRYAEIIRQMELISNLWIDPNTVVGTGGTGELAPTAFGFQMVGLFGDAAWVTADELNPGMTLVSTACIKRCIARGLINDMFRAIDVYDPTKTTTTGTSGINNAGTLLPLPRFGTRIYVADSLQVNAYETSFEIGPYAANIAAAEATISVSLLF